MIYFHSTRLGPISKICFGCEALGGVDWGSVDILEIEKAISMALELGINFFDTAAIYNLGLSESRLANVLGSKRKEVIIASKGGLSWDKKTSAKRAMVSRDSSETAIRKGVEDSLRRLKIERIPIYYIHWPDRCTSFSETFGCLNNLVEEGKIGEIGCSNFSVDELRSVLKISDISFLQIPANILRDSVVPEVSRLAKANDFQIVGYNCLASGLLTGKYSPGHKFEINDRRSRQDEFRGDMFRSSLAFVSQIKKRAVASGLTTAQYSLKTLIEDEQVSAAIVGIKSIQQLEENTSWTQNLGQTAWNS